MAQSSGSVGTMLQRPFRQKRQSLELEAITVLKILYTQGIRRVGMSSELSSVAGTVGAGRQCSRKIMR